MKQVHITLEKKRVSPHNARLLEYNLQKQIAVWFLCFQHGFRFCLVCFSLSRWNVVGIQGSLMSYFTEPIYFSSIILGSLYHADHLSRAMYQRIADIEDLPQQFTLNRPLLSGKSPHWSEIDDKIRKDPLVDFFFSLKFPAVLRGHVHNLKK